MTRRHELRHLLRAVFLIAALGADRADAGCTQSSEASTVKKSIRQAMKCDDKLLRSGNASCTVTPPPACAGTLVTDANNLAYGLATLAEVDKRSLRDQLKCQKRIGKAVSYYVGTKLISLIRGKTPAEAEAKAVKHLDKLADYCTIPVGQDTGTGLVLPRVGPQCAAAIGVPAGTVDTVNPAALRDCLRQLSEVWVDRWGPNPQPLRPNIIFILSDDQRWDTTDDTHSPVPGQNIMPGLRSELGGAGAEFVNAFMTTPLCCPSRSSILSGQYSHTTGVYTNGGDNGGADDFDDSVSIGTILQSAGYRTGFHGKYLNGYQQLWTDPAPPYVPPGWNDWRAFKQVRYFDYTMIENGVEVAYGSAEADYSTDVLREKAKQFITDSVALGQPFFLHLSFKAPHGPFNPPDAGPAPRHDGMFAGLAPWRPASHNELDVSDKPMWVQDTPPLTAMEIANLDNVRIRQLEMLQAVDEAIGGSTTYGITGIMQHLRNLGVADNTLVIYFADNGWHWGEHRYRAKNKPYEESIRAPMFVYYPKLVPLPRVESKFALNIDFCPTFAELALPTGTTAPIVFDGVSLVRLFDGTAPSWRTDFLTEGWPASHVWASVREANWKYTELPLLPGNPMSGFEYELYDLQNDPLELNSLDDTNDPILLMRMASMKARLHDGVLRPLWPDDSDAAAEEPDDDE